MNPAPRDRRVPTPVTRVAGASMVFLLVLTGTAASAGPRSLSADGGLRSAAMLMATLQEAARRLASVEDSDASAPPAAATASPRPSVLVAQTPRHLSPPRPGLCVLPPPAS